MPKSQKTQERGLAYPPKQDRCLRRVLTKLDDIQAEMRLRFTEVETGLAAIDHPLAALHAVDAARADQIADLRRRLERVEQRLELADAV